MAKLDKRTAAGRRLSRCRYFEITDDANATSGMRGHRCPESMNAGYYRMCDAHSNDACAGHVRRLKTTLPHKWITDFYARTEAVIEMQPDGRLKSDIHDPFALVSPVVSQTPPPAAAPATPPPAAPLPVQPTVVPVPAAPPAPVVTTMEAAVEHWRRAAAAFGKPRT